MKRLFLGLLLAVVVFASSYAVFKSGFFRVHDFTHAARVSQLALALQDGHFPVRWSKDFGYGYGMPLFEFYAPLPFYVGGLLFSLGIPVLTVLKILWLLCAVGTVLGSYRLGKSLGGELSGILTAAAITLAPYRAVNLYVRGALSEAWAIMALPWILYGLVASIRHRDNRGWLFLVFGLVGLLLSHNITTLLFIPLSVLFGIGLLLERLIAQDVAYIHKKKLQYSQLLQVAWKVLGSYALAFALAAFYVVPAFVEKNLTKVDEFILSPYFNYKLHFLYIRQFLQPNWGYGGSAWGVDDNISFFLGWGQLAALVFAGVVLSVAVLKLTKISAAAKGKAFFLFWLFGLLGLSLFMSLLKAQPIWDALPLLKFAQFPWRWLAVVVPFLGVIVGVSVVGLDQRWRMPVAGALFLILLCNAPYFRPESYLDEPEALYYTDAGRISRDMSGILMDYIPAGMPEKLEPPLSLVSFVTDPGQDVTAVQVLVDRTQEKLIETNFAQAQTIVIALAAFPGWRLELDGETASSQVYEGRLSLSVPAGPHKVGVIFDTTPVRLLSDWVSFGALLVLVYLCLPTKVSHE